MDFVSCWVVYLLSGCVFHKSDSWKIISEFALWTTGPNVINKIVCSEKKKKNSSSKWRNEHWNKWMQWLHDFLFRDRFSKRDSTENRLFSVVSHRYHRYYFNSLVHYNHFTLNVMQSTHIAATLFVDRDSMSRKTKSVLNFAFIFSFAWKRVNRLHNGHLYALWLATLFHPSNWFFLFVRIKLSKFILTIKYYNKSGRIELIHFDLLIVWSLCRANIILNQRQ